MTAEVARARHRAGTAATLVAVVVGALVLVGWWTGTPDLFTFGGRARTTPVSAVSLLLVALATGRTGRARVALGWTAAAFGAASLLVEDALLDLQQLAFPTADSVSAPGTAAVVLLLTTSLLLRRRLPDTANGLAFAAGSVALVAAVGPWVGWEWAATAGAAEPSSGMAWPTTALALSVIVGLTWSAPEGRWDVAGLHRGAAVMLAVSVATPWIVVVAVGETGRAGYLAGVLGAALVAVLLSRSLGGTTQRVAALRSLVDTAPDATLVVDELGRIVSVNDQLAELAGRRRMDLESAGIDSLVPPRVRDGHAALRDRFTAAGEARPMAATGPIELRRGDGTDVAVDVALAPVQLDGNRFTIATVRDMTAHRAAMDELRRVDALRRSMLQAVSHELRTPLAVLLSITGVLRAGHHGMAPTKVDELLDRAEGSAQQLSDLVHDLLEVQRLSGGSSRQTVRVEPDAVEAAVRRAVDAVGLADVGIAVAAGAPPVLVDERLLERVLVHLLDNADKYAPGPVEVTFVPVDGGAELRVEDHGDGPPVGLVERIFEPFDRGVHAQTADAGIGIGLSLVAGFAEHAGGRAWVTRRDDGRSGASFRCWLPAALEVEVTHTTNARNHR